MATVAPQPISTGRWSEAGLLLLAVALGVSGYLLVGLNIEGTAPSELLPMAGTLAGIAVVAHLVLRWRAPYADPVLLPLALGLNGVGLAMIYRIDYATGDAAGPRQLIWTALGAALAVTIVIALRDHRQLRRFTYTSLVVSLFLLLLPMVPGLGQEINGAQLWIRIAGFSFQPAEIAKITLAIFFAGFLANNRDLILLAGRKIGPLTFPRLQDLAPLFLGWLIAMGVLIVQNDLGNALMFFGLFVAVIYVATSRFSWIAIGGVLVAVGALLAYQFVPHARNRFNIWLNAFDPEIYDRMYGSHQLVQGMFGLAHGGLAGTGLGNGSPHMVALANSDMIITAFGEELGFLGLAAMLLLYLILFSRYMRAGIGSRDHFGKLLAVSFAVILVLQVFVVVGGITRVIPMSGLVSPFLAAGGSALLANWLIVAIVLLISHAARRPILSGPMLNTTGEGASGTEDPLRRDGGRPVPAEPTAEADSTSSSGGAR